MTDLPLVATLTGYLTKSPLFEAYFLPLIVLHYSTCPHLGNKIPLPPFSLWGVHHKGSIMGLQGFLAENVRYAFL